MRKEAPESVGQPPATNHRYKSKGHEESDPSFRYAVHPRYKTRRNFTYINTHPRAITAQNQQQKRLSFQSSAVSPIHRENNVLYHHHRSNHREKSRIEPDQISLSLSLPARLKAQLQRHTRKKQRAVRFEYAMRRRNAEY